ncbi:F-box only protein 22 [Bufo gargarizans]|uniref:F-box only protein 22 n=1 Tax=Bufo gargarizans TaxID=30331 RepID=UPI001CF0D91E|nr:F-box only protein 22 [Bufo gargarizans]
MGDMDSYGEVLENNGPQVPSSPESVDHYVLSTLPEVVERVMSFLPGKALLQAACVCRLWRDCAWRKRKERQRVTWISAVGAGDLDLGGHSLVQVVQEELEKVYIIPEMFLYFTDFKSLNDHRPRSGPKKAKKKHGLETTASLENLLPKDCKIVGLSTPGIVVTPGGSASNQPVELEDGESGFALLFPKINGVKIQHFHFRDSKTVMFDEYKLEEAGLKNNPDLRVVLIFGYNTWKHGAIWFLHKVLNPLNKKSIIIAGGLAECLASFSSQPKTRRRDCIGVVGLALSGPQIQGATILLDEDVCDEKTTDSAMQRLKAANIPEENSVGLMFACVGRGEQHYKKKNVEADSFRKHFPNVPLFGFFGNGEIGCDRVVSGSFTLRECNAEEDNLLHEYCTVMTIIHFGHSK